MNNVEKKQVADMQYRYNNQLDIFNPDTHGDKKILIVGAGGIGSTTAYSLAQMGFRNITVIDFDDVENHNISSQFYKEADIGKAKVTALAENVLAFTGIKITAVKDKFSPGYAKGMDIVIAAVDNMATRKEIIEGCNPKLAILDGRMEREIFQVFVVTQWDKDVYMKEYWFPDNPENNPKCTEKSISYNGLAIASVMSKYCGDLARGESLRAEVIGDWRSLMFS